MNRTGKYKIVYVTEKLWKALQVRRIVSSGFLVVTWSSEVFLC